MLMRYISITKHKEKTNVELPVHKVTKRKYYIESISLTYSPKYLFLHWYIICIINNCTVRRGPTRRGFSRALHADRWLCAKQCRSAFGLASAACRDLQKRRCKSPLIFIICILSGMCWKNIYTFLNHNLVTDYCIMLNTACINSIYLKEL